METVGNIQVVATINTKGYDDGKQKITSGNKDLDESSKKTGNTLSSNISNGANYAGESLKKFAKVAAVALAATATAVVAYGVSSFKSYEEAEASSVKLRNAVVNVSGATEDQLKATSDLADELERKGVLDGDNIKVGLAQLSTFGLSNKAVQNLAGSLADLAVNQYGVTATGDDLEDSANTIAKALNGQFGILEKSGIRFTAAQKSIIQYGTETEKVVAINEGFQQNLKYTNAVAKTTSEGGIARMKVGLENVQEAIGGAIANGINPLVQKLSEFVQSEQFTKWVDDITTWLSINLPIAFDYLITTVIPSMQKAFTDMQPYLVATWDILTDIGNFLGTDLGKYVAIATIVIAGLSTVFGGLVSAIGAPIIMPAIAVATSLAAIASVVAAYNDMQSALAGQKTAEENLAKIRMQTYNVMKNISDNGVLLGKSQSQIDAANRWLQNNKGASGGGGGSSGWATGGFTGTGGVNEVAGLVHKGEYVFSKDMVNQSTGMPKLSNLIGGMIGDGGVSGSVVPLSKINSLLDNGGNSKSRDVTINQTNNVSTELDMDVINRSLTWQLRRA